jgi:hypothetical protein
VVGDLKATMAIEQTKPGSALDDQLRREQAKAIFYLLASQCGEAKGADQ